MIIFKVCIIIICFVSFFQSLKIIEGLSQSHLGFSVVVLMRGTCPMNEYYMP